jgi:sec-independent protein translocase protein TatA
MKKVFHQRKLRINTMLTSLSPATLPLPLLFLPSLGFGELALLFLLVLILFGPGKLPQVAKSLGESLKQFRTSSNPNTPTEIAPSVLEKTEEKPPEEPSGKA